MRSSSPHSSRIENSLKKLSATALSQQLPLRLMLCFIPLLFSISLNSPQPYLSDKQRITTKKEQEKRKYISFVLFRSPLGDRTYFLSLYLSVFYKLPFFQLTESLTGLTYVLAAIAIMLRYKISVM